MRNWSILVGEEDDHQGRQDDVTMIASNTAKRQSVAYAGFCQRASLLFPPFFREVHEVDGPGLSLARNFKNHPRRNRRRETAPAAVGKKCDASTSQSNKFWRQS